MGFVGLGAGLRCAVVHQIHVVLAGLVLIAKVDGSIRIEFGEGGGC